MVNFYALSVTTVISSKIQTFRAAKSAERSGGNSCCLTSKEVVQDRTYISALIAGQRS